MRRTKRWWRRLTKIERSCLVYLEAHRDGGRRGGWNLPDNCGECAACGETMLGSGWCTACSKMHTELVNKAEGVQT